MRKKLLDYIVCPSCKSKLELEGEITGSAHVVKGRLKCAGCANSYEIKDGIPRFVPIKLDSVKSRTAKSFGYEWRRFGEIDRKNENEFLSYLDPLESKDLQGKVVLDAGCGMGKFAFLAGRYQAKDVIAIDFSSSVEMAYKNTSQLDNVHVIQADIYNLPLKKEFDFIYSIGVLHHLPEPEKGFSTLAGLVKESGKIFAWVYGKEGNWLYLTFAEPLRKFLTSWLPLPVNEFLAFILAGILWLVICLVYVPLTYIGLSRLLPLSEYFLYFRRLGFRIFWATVLDKMIPPISNYYSQNEFRKWFERAGLKEIYIGFRNSNSWKGFGTK